MGKQSPLARLARPKHPAKQRSQKRPHPLLPRPRQPKPPCSPPASLILPRRPTFETPRPRPRLRPRKPSDDEPSWPTTSSASGDPADPADPADPRPYIEQHLARLVHTLEITPLGSKDRSVLEMGAYMQITPALATKLGYGVVRGSYFGPLGAKQHKQVRLPDGETFECTVDLFDAEKDPYPYADESFSTVLCCELLEHLYEDPMHMMAEINRILKPGGHLVLSTPNICSLRSVGAVLLGYHPGLFHQYIKPNEKGEVEPRHSREYTPRDVRQLLEAAGFSVERLETGPYAVQRTAEYEWVKHVIRRYDVSADLRGEVIYAAGKKINGVADRYPLGLYCGGES